MHLCEALRGIIWKIQPTRLLGCIFLDDFVLLHLLDCFPFSSSRLSGRYFAALV